MAPLVRARTTRSTPPRTAIPANAWSSRGPNPDYISRQLHHGVDRLSEQLIQVHESIGNSVDRVAAMVGYTEVARHGSYFGDGLTEEYRVLVSERAPGLPLLCDFRDRFRGIPVGLALNLFALHPLVPHIEAGCFGVQMQLMDLEEAFHRSGHLLLDLGPHNVYFDPREGRITVIDIGTIPTQGPASQGRANVGTQDFHDFFAELFRFYATPEGPLTEAEKYGEPSGMRGIPVFSRQLDALMQSFSGAERGELRDAALTILQKIRDRSYESFEEFRGDFSRYLGLAEARIRGNPDIEALRTVWMRALEGLSGDYFKRFLFDPATDLAHYRPV